VANLRASSATVAVAVCKAAADDGVATRQHDNLVQAVQDAMWQPVYPADPQPWAMATTVQDDLGLVLDAARILHTNGERTAVTEALAAELAAHLNLAVRLELSWTAAAVHLLVDGVESDARSAPASPVAVNMARVRAVHGAIAVTQDGRLDRARLAAALRKGDHLPAAPLWIFVSACITGAVALALIFGAHRPEAIACIAVAAALGAFCGAGSAPGGWRNRGKCSSRRWWPGWPEL
jgi:hypothetical protein